MTGESAPGPAARVLLAALRFYQLGISPLLGPRCRFVPSCSAYAVEAVSLHGAARGSLLATWRLLRCHPLHPGGHDPVPALRGGGPSVDVPRPAGRTRPAGPAGGPHPPDPL